MQKEQVFSMAVGKILFNVLQGAYIAAAVKLCY